MTWGWRIKFLQVTIDKPADVKVLEGDENFGSVKAGSSFGKAFVGGTLQDTKKLSARAEIHDKVNMFGRGPTPMKRDDKWVVGRGQNLPFSHDTLHLILLNHFFLGEHCVGGEQGEYERDAEGRVTS